MDSNTSHYTIPVNLPIEPDSLLGKLLREKRTGIEFQERKHTDWNENYELVRGKIKTNRLTQRQAVNIPLMKETEKTILSRIDDPPDVEWKELGGDEQKELYYQEIWNDQFRKGKFEWKDILDKKNVLRYGLSTKKLNISDKGITVDIIDVFDILYDPLMNPLDIESARFIIHRNIFKSLRDILADKRYTKEGRDSLRIWASNPASVVQTSNNEQELKKKQERLRAMGVQSDQFAHFAGGDTIVNLTEHFTNVWNTKTQEFERRVVVYADDHTQLLDEPLYDLIGVDFWPFEVWSEDPETNDVYPDSIDDLVRTPNKVINIWFSQMVENRTLRNFQMHWYDATNNNYKPQTYEPGPGVMMPAPGDPSKTIMPVDVSGLDETMNAITFITSIVERGSGATAIEKGVAEQGQQTLGEVQILVGKAMERATTMAKFYRGSWYNLAVKWDKMMHANAPKMMKLYKSSRNGTLFEKTLYSSEWKSKMGYQPIVSSSSEQESEETKTIQKFQFLLSQFPGNGALRRIAQKRELQLVDLNPEELREIEDEEKQNEAMRKQQPEQNQPDMAGLNQSLQQLQSLNQNAQ